MRQLESPRLAVARMAPGLALDELLLNLFPIVEAGVLELVVGAGEPENPSGEDPIVFEECRSGARSRSLDSPKGVRVVSNRNDDPDSAHCLAPADELVPWVHAWLRRSIGLDSVD